MNNSDCVRIYRVLIVPVEFKFVTCPNTPCSNPAIFVRHSDHFHLDGKDFMQGPNWLEKWVHYGSSQLVPEVIEHISSNAVVVT